MRPGLAIAVCGFAARALGAGDGLALPSFDRTMEQFMRERGIAGGALAVVKDRRLIYARGYGLADREKQTPVAPDSLFRIASLAKPFTAVAVLQLVEQGKLKLDNPAFDILKLDPVLARGASPDPRLKKITIRHLLQHTGGWDARRSFDPMFRSTQIGRAVGGPYPPGPEAVIRFMLGQQLQFDPGTRYAYSNFGYCVLGRIIEKVSGMSYEAYVKKNVLAPIEITRMRIGASLPDGRVAGEVAYHVSGTRKAASVFPGVRGFVPEPYGGFCLEAMDAHGGWVASVVDLTRFAVALDDPQRCPLLKPDTIRLMYAPPEPPVWRKPDGLLNDYYYGCGWLVRPVTDDGKANCWHTGSLPGTYSLLVRRYDELDWAVLFNQRSADPSKPDTKIDPALHSAAAAADHWPSEDLFPRYR